MTCCGGMHERTTRSFIPCGKMPPRRAFAWQKIADDLAAKSAEYTLRLATPGPPSAGPTFMHAV